MQARNGKLSGKIKKGEFVYLLILEEEARVKEYENVEIYLKSIKIDSIH
jgi:hypothetical protein